ncbi:hypothetical protein P154DRAFT_526046 [Amniculicola lignicola CBS 123094]|uniref:Elongator complex protein 6 n=1 Tax=Amniculicola lignicola CBS 123094 TaxID=1392246 RepID=A0A6A5W229_9PLEO|nr:hypothetical protein P154DRAFT_526046 [Amniculicola lignicola CBS 123094]
MPPSTRIPPLLQPYTKFPSSDSIFLLTSVLGASANWLIIRFLCEAWQKNEGEEEGFNVVLVSWMRDWEFWKGEGRKAGGLDMQRLASEKRLAFVDGLSGMFLASENGGGEGPGTSKGTEGGIAGMQTFPVRKPTPGRIPARTTAQPSAPVSSQPKPTSTGLFTLSSPSLPTLESTVRSAIDHLSSSPKRQTVLILDSLDTLLATSPELAPSTLLATVLTLHTMTTHVLLHLSADDALLSTSIPAQPLEVNGHNLLVKAAHMSRRVLSCRVLDTGVARDVSGVLRVTGGGDGGGMMEMLKFEENRIKNAEMLYLVKGDGSVKVFERGAGEG